jgi:biopolymer transport protein ExbB
MTLLLAFLGAVWAQSAPATNTLEQAYQKEYAYLAAEKKELAERLAEVESGSASKVAAATAELDALQARLVAASRDADRSEDAFDQLERETAAMDDANTVLSSTVQQASDTLGLGTTEDPAGAVPTVFSTVADKLAKENQAGWTDGSFFLPDGREVSGRIYRWGQVAAWGVSADGTGALGPVTGEHLQLRRSFGTGTAQALAVDEQPAVLEINLFEPDRVSNEKEKARGLRETLKEAGTMGQFLFALGCLSAALALTRGITLVFARRGGMPLVSEVTTLVQAGNVEKAKGLLARARGPIARVLRAVLDGAHRTRDELERVIDEAILRETPVIDRFASALVVITAGAPLLGLLGTVTGMIATFDVITEHGTGNPKLMSAGIAEALVCTALGLAVAIPTLLIGNVLASVAGNIKNTLDRGALATLNALDLRARMLARDDEPSAPVDHDLGESRAEGFRATS